MQLAFKGAPTGGVISKLFDRAICWWTGSKYCHVEIVFDVIDVGPQNNALCFSSDQSDGGVRFKRVDLTDAKIWTLVKLNVGIAQEDQAHYLASKLVGRGYDWAAIASFLLPPLDPCRGKLVGPTKFICSAVCVYVCQQIGKFLGNPPAETNPGLLYNLAISDLKEVTCAA